MKITSCASRDPVALIIIWGCIDWLNYCHLSTSKNSWPTFTVTSTTASVCETNKESAVRRLLPYTARTIRIYLINRRSAPYGTCTQIPYSSSLRYLQKHIVALVLCVASLALYSLWALLVTNLPSHQPVSLLSLLGHKTRSVEVVRNVCSLILKDFRTSIKPNHNLDKKSRKKHFKESKKMYVSQKPLIKVNL